MNGVESLALLFVTIGNRLFGVLFQHCISALYYIAHTFVKNT